MTRWLTFALLLALAPSSRADDPPKPKAERVKEQKDALTAEAVTLVPYRLTDTKHVLVRAKINGKGPFNLILDTGAPAVFLAKKPAKKAGLETDDEGWAKADTFELEGGLKVTGVKTRVSDLFQLEGMNGMGLAGVELDGVIGYNVLAKFRVTYDFTLDKLKFVTLDFTPPAVTARGKSDSQGGMDLLGPAMKMLAGFMGIKPNFAVEPRGFLGVELADLEGALTVVAVVKGSPADRAGLKAGDRVTGASRAFTRRNADPSVNEIDNLKEFARWVGPMRPGQRVKVEVKRVEDTKTVTVEFGKGM
jgi:serine protease DegQ